MDDLTPSHFLTIENALPEIPHPHGVPALHPTSLHARYLCAKDEGRDKLRCLSEARITQTYHRPVARSGQTPYR
jgi:hypothetical protein